MLEQLRLHTITHLRFFLRSRLVLGFGLVMLAMVALSFVPFVLMDSSGGRFERLTYASTLMHTFAWAYGAVLALLGMSTHLRERMTRLVFTRPASPEVWTASMLLAAFTVSAVAHVLVAAGTLGFSLLWNLPYQTGFLWVAVDGIFESLIVIALLGAIGAALHPAIAAVASIFLHDGMFLGLMSMTSGAIEAGNTSAWLRAADWTVRALYAVMPMLNPFESETSVGSSMRASLTDWAYLGATGAYAAALTAFCFFATVWILRRRQL